MLSVRFCATPFFQSLATLFPYALYSYPATYTSGFLLPSFMQELNIVVAKPNAGSNKNLK